MHFWAYLHIRTKLAAAALLLFLATFILLRPIYSSIREDSRHAEAKIMLGHLSALQAAHFADHGFYPTFTEPYGAPVSGRENCEQPAGAKALGFRISGCQKKSPRYTYKVFAVVDPQTGLPSTKRGYLAEAVSGSDIEGSDLVCQSGKDTWQVGPDRLIKHLMNCE